MQQLKEILKPAVCAPYRAIPFWSWNDKLEVQGLLAQVAWMDDNHIGGFFMHARSGLQTEYMSEEWMECIEACAKEAEKRGMKAWIYDENGWPSGFAGGKLLEDEKNRDKYIEIKEGDFDESATVSYLLTEDKLVRVAEPVKDEAEDIAEPDGDNPKTIAESTGEETSTSARYLNLYIRTAVSTADILNPAVVDKFLALTHEKYKERFGEQFSEKIAGFFTDEPQYQRWHTPYTDVIAAYFEEKFGEDILDSLGLLFVEKEGYRSFRYRYWKGMQELMLQNYSEKVYNWCQENNVKFTGHYVEETTLGCQLMCCGGVMPFYEYEHIPGIDWLGTGTDTELSAVQVASVAAQLEKKQVLTETFGCCGWDVTPTDLRRIAGFQYVHGVNMMCHHLIPYTERGTRKYDYPAHYSDVNPWVAEEFGTFNTYFTRLGCLLGEGKQAVHVAVLHPLRSAYFNYKREAEHFGVRELDKALYDTNKLLGRQGIAYHYLDETLLAKYGFVKDRHIGCGACSYEYLVLPKVYTMDRTTEALVRQFVEQGGKLLLLDEKPSYIEAEPFDYPYLVTNCTIEDIAKSQPFRVKNKDVDIYTAYRKLDGMEYLYVMNSSQSATLTQEFIFEQNVQSFTKVDLTDLSEKQVPLRITLKPGEDALLFLKEEPVAEEKELIPYELLFQNAEIAFKENALPIDHIRYSEDGQTYSKPWPHAALFQKLIKERYEGTIFFRYEFDVQELPERIFLRAEASHEVQAWLNGALLTEKLPSEQGYINVYDITSQVVLGRNEYTVQVNWHEDESVHYALFGENVTESLKNCVVYDSELQPIQLAGRFGVYPRTGYAWTERQYVEGNDFYIGKVPGTVCNLTIEGFPFLAGEVTLSQNVVFEKKDILLKLAGDYQMAEVTVNGVKLGRLLFDKEMDISEAAVAGVNEISVRFWISNRNLMGPHHRNGSRRAGVAPSSFDLSGSWQEDKSAAYHDSYDLKLFYRM